MTTKNIKIKENVLPHLFRSRFPICQNKGWIKYHSSTNKMFSTFRWFEVWPLDGAHEPMSVLRLYKERWWEGRKLKKHGYRCPCAWCNRAGTGKEREVVPLRQWCSCVFNIWVRKLEIGGRQAKVKVTNIFYSLY